MYEDQGMVVDYDDPVPFTSADSDKESGDDGDDDDDDLGDEFADLTQHMSG
jgi:hypothetical protein